MKFLSNKRQKRESGGSANKVKEIIKSKSLRPLGNKSRLTQTDSTYNVRLFLFADKRDSQTYYNTFIDYAGKAPPPFCIEIMHVNINTIFDEPFGLVFPYERTDTRPEYALWFREANLTCNETLRNFQAADHSYRMLSQNVRELYDWTILTSPSFDFNSPEADDIFSDPPDSGYAPLKVM